MNDTKTEGWAGVFTGQARALEEGASDVGIGYFIAIGNLKRKIDTWTAEINLSGSGMTHKDIDFLRRQIRKLEEAKVNADKLFKKMAEDIKAHTEAW